MTMVCNRQVDDFQVCIMLMTSSEMQIIFESLSCKSLVLVLVMFKSSSVMQIMAKSEMLIIFEFLLCTTTSFWHMSMIFEYKYYAAVSWCWGCSSQCNAYDLIWIADHFWITVMHITSFYISIMFEYFAAVSWCTRWWVHEVLRETSCILSSTKPCSHVLLTQKHWENSLENQK